MTNETHGSGRSGKHALPSGDGAGGARSMRVQSVWLFDHFFAVAVGLLGLWLWGILGAAVGAFVGAAADSARKVMAGREGSAKRPAGDSPRQSDRAGGVGAQAKHGDGNGHRPTEAFPGEPAGLASYDPVWISELRVGRLPAYFFSALLLIVGYLLGGPLGAGIGVAIGFSVDKWRMTPVKTSERTQSGASEAKGEKLSFMQRLFGKQMEMLNFGLMLLVPMGYTAVMVAANLAQLDILSVWIEFTRPLTDAMSGILPVMDRYTGQLISRGYGARVPFVRHMLAMNFALVLPFVAVCVGRTYLDGLSGSRLFIPGKTCGVVKPDYEKIGRYYFRMLLGFVVVVCACYWIAIYGKDIDFYRTRRGFYVHKYDFYFFVFAAMNWLLFLALSFLVYLVQFGRHRKRVCQ